MTDLTFVIHSAVQPAALRHPELRVFTAPSTTRRVLGINRTCLPIPGGIPAAAPRASWLQRICVNEPNARKPAHTLTLPAAVRTSCEKFDIGIFTLIFNVISYFIRELTEVLVFRIETAVLDGEDTGSHYTTRGTSGRSLANL